MEDAGSLGVRELVGHVLHQSFELRLWFVEGDTDLERPKTVGVLLVPSDSHHPTRDRARGPGLRDFERDGVTSFELTAYEQERARLAKVSTDGQGPALLIDEFEWQPDRKPLGASAFVAHLRRCYQSSLGLVIPARTLPYARSRGAAHEPPTVPNY